MSVSWLQQSERSTSGVLGIMSWIARRLGRGAARLLLYPISAYFVVFSRRSRRASSDYLRRMRSVEPTWRDIFRHYHCFASTILDRIYLLSGRHDLFDIRIHGREALQRYESSSGGGCLLLGAHLGSFELLRSLGTLHFKLPIRVLMYEENARKVGELLRAMNSDLATRIIPIGLPDTLIRVKEALERGEMVGMLGDRLLSDHAAVVCDFLGDRAQFPTGPVRLATLFRVPVVLFFGLYRGGNRYDIHFELLSESLHGARNSPEQIREWTQKYVERLEYYCRLAPYNWFNFYDFWVPDAPAAVRAAA